jgi:hypothetical protein
MEPIDTPLTSLTDEALINYLRRAAGIWFKNTDLLLLEEFIRRFNKRSLPCPPSKNTNPPSSPSSS